MYRDNGLPIRRAVRASQLDSNRAEPSRAEPSQVESSGSRPRGVLVDRERIAIESATKSRGQTATDRGESRRSFSVTGHDRFRWIGCGGLLHSSVGNGWEGLKTREKHLVPEGNGDRKGRFAVEHERRQGAASFIL